MIKKLKQLYYYAVRRSLPWARFLVFRIEDIIFFRSSRSVVNCLGDSHTEVFKSPDMKKMVGVERLRVVTVQGATAFGLSNPNSKTNAITIFKRELRAIPKNQNVVLMLGEVDCGFLVWLQAEKYGTSEIEQMQESLCRYTELLSYIADRNFSSVAVVSVPPPTIEDGCQSGLVASQRKKISATQVQRTQLTCAYNAKLKKIATGFGFGFVDMSDAFIDSETGLVDLKFKNKNPSDHHLEISMVAPEYASALKDFFQGKK